MTVTQSRKLGWVRRMAMKSRYVEAVSTV